MSSSLHLSFASERKEESSYGGGKPTSPDYAHETSSSHNEHDPSLNRPPPNTSLLESDAAPTSDVYTTSSHQSSQALISGRTREAVENFYDHTYGPNSRLCLVSRVELLTIAYIVKYHSRPKQVW